MSIMNTDSCCRREPLTPAQIEIWLDQSIHPESTQYIISAHYNIEFPVDPDRLIAASNWVFSHYEALYARLIAGPETVPEVLFDPANAPQCKHWDLSGEPDPQEALQQLIHRQTRTLFQMLDSPLSRPVLIKTADSSFCYLCTYHHNLIDGWGAGIVFSRIARAYECLERGLEPTREGGSFADYLDQCQKPQKEHMLEEAKTFWKPLLASRLPSIRPSHACRKGEDELAASCVEVTLSRELADGVSRQASASNATLFHALLLAYSYVIGKQFSLESSALFLPILNRGKEHKETIGLFVESRTTPLPLNENASVSENLNAIARRVRGVFRHYRLSAAELTRLYQSQGNVGAPTGDSAVSYVTRDFGATIDGVSVRMKSVPPAHEKSPLALFVLDTYPGQDIQIQLVYQHRYLTRDQAELVVRKLPHILESFAKDPGCKLCEVNLVPPEERRRIASVLRRDAAPAASPPPIIEGILERARKCPDAIAVETGDSRSCYRECVEKANAIAQSLIHRHGVRPGDRVALLLLRGADLISGYLAVMMAGATFVPLEPHGPEIRARQICEDSDAKCIVTNADLSGKTRTISVAKLFADALEGSKTPFAPLAALDQIAYIIYTSGSTGRPKGVEVSHRALAEHVASWLQVVPLRETCERVLFFHSPAFDVTIETVFPSLLLGNTLVAAPHPQWTVYELAKVIVSRRLSVIYLPPACLLEFLKHMQDEPRQLAGHVVRMCLTGGDAMHAETAPLWDAAFGPSAQLFNLYGPTEATVTATLFNMPFGYRAAPGESIPIGKVHSGRTLRIVDGRGRDVPIGAEGELLIGGLGLATAYHNMPTETAERFVTLEDGMRYYRSGDVVKLKSDGNIVFRRRLDKQVKIRGFRVEPGEIEACILTHRDVLECAVVARPGADGRDWELRAYVALRAGSKADGHPLHQHLSTQLPDYMVPPIFVLDRLPKNVSNKIDRSALLSLEIAPEQPSSSTAACSPKGAVQEYLAVLWEGALGTHIVDAGADFFELGGHSLLAAKLIADIGKAFRLEYPFATFFDKPTIAETERNLEQLVGDNAKLETMARVRMELAHMSEEEVKAKLAATRHERM